MANKDDIHFTLVKVDDVKLVSLNPDLLRQKELAGKIMDDNREVLSKLARS